MKHFILTLLAAIISLSPVSAYSMDDKSVREAYLRSYNYMNQGDYKNAINALVLVHNAEASTYTINLRLGYLYYLNKNYANAKAHYLEAQRIVPNAVTPQLGLMRISNILENFEDTELSGYKILQTDGYNYYANLYLAYALRKSQKYDAAEAVTLKMLAVYPEDTGFLLEYGLLNYIQGRNLKAFNALRYLLIFEPENVSANEVLGLIRQQEGSMRR